MDRISQILKYSDNYGVTHLYPNPDKYGSQNGPMYSGLAWLLYVELTGNRLAVPTGPIDSLCPDNVCQTTPGPAGTPMNFSHDNMTGIVVWRKAGGLDQRLWPYNFRQWSHPRDICFYLYTRFPYLFWTLLPIPCVAMIVSCAQTYKVRNGRKVVKTDGKLLTFMRCIAFKENLMLKLTFQIGTWFIKRNPKLRSWTQISNMYFKDLNHPINLMMAEWEIKNDKRV